VLNTVSVNQTEGYMRINLILCLIFIFHEQVIAKRRQYDSFVLSSGVVSNLYTDGNLYPETNGSFNSDLVQDIGIEFSSNKKNDKIEAVFYFSSVKYENTALKIVNKKDGLIFKFRYFPFEIIQLNDLFAAAIVQGGNIGGGYTIDSQKRTGKSVLGIGLGFGYDLHVSSNFRIIFEYNSVRYYNSNSSDNNKFDSYSNTLRIGIGYMK